MTEAAPTRTVTIRIPSPLRAFTGGAAEVAVEGTSVGAALRALAGEHGGLTRHLFTGDGALREFINVYLGDTNIRSLDGLDSPLPAGGVVSIVPAVAGGSGAHRRRLGELRELVREVSVETALGAQRDGALLIDVREPDEVAGGSPVAAARLVRGFLELEIEGVEPDLDRPLLVLCAGGTRSLYAARGLQELGYRDVCSVAGGFAAWKRAGQPIDVPRSLSAEERERYGRHLSIPEVGEEGQARLLDSRVLLVGAGGLGSPAAIYLAAAGVGTIGIVDDDRVDRSNLQRQILHTDDRVGTPKVESARIAINALNPSTRVVAHRERLTKDNVEEIFAGYDLVLDGTDNFPTRYLVNDACVKLRLPNVHGAIFRFDGQVSVFWPARAGSQDGHAQDGHAGGPCYRCLFPEPPPAELAPSCAEAGVLGVLPGVVGTMQAVEAIKILLGVGRPLVGRLLLYDALEQRFTELKVERRPDCAWCGDGAEISEYPDYEVLCSTSNAA